MPFILPGGIPQTSLFDVRSPFALDLRFHLENIGDLATATYTYVGMQKALVTTGEHYVLRDTGWVRVNNREYDPNRSYLKGDIVIVPPVPELASRPVGYPVEGAARTDLSYYFTTPRLFYASADMNIGQHPMQYTAWQPCSGGSENYRGAYTSLANLQAAIPTGILGNYAQVDTGAGNTAKHYIWDAQDGWVLGSAVGPSSSDQVPEGVTNLYFTDARVRSTPLTGLNTSTATAVTASDTVLSAIGKLMAWVNQLVSGLEFTPTDSNNTTGFWAGLLVLGKTTFSAALNRVRDKYNSLVQGFVSIAYSPTFSVDAAGEPYPIRRMVCTGNAEMTAVANFPSGGGMLMMKFIASGGQRTITLPSTYAMKNGVSRVITLDAGKSVEVLVIYDGLSDGNNWEAGYSKFG